VNVVDSSAWIEYFTGGSNARYFEPAILSGDDLVLPTIVLLEVYRHIRRHKGRDAALKAVAAMKGGEVQDLDERLALLAAEIGVEHGLPLADSVILATARLHGATLWTQDADFEGLAGVRYRKKRS